MEKIQLLYVLLLCVSVAVVFILGIIFERSQSGRTVHLIILPIEKETENIELIAREILARAEEKNEKTIVIIYDMGASDEQLLIFDKIAGNSLEYIVVKDD
ncbi:MAG: hypothetical protein ACI4I1_05120 [Oscillospiraceae bacterium]